jgi:OOP family OmpA-OmpF porin
MFVRKSILSIAAVLMTAALPLAAADTGFLVGGGLGRSTIDIESFYPEIGNEGENLGSGYQEQHNSAWKLYGGYRFLRFVAVEASWFSLGSPQVWETTVQEDPERAEVSVKGFDAFVVGILPVSNSFDIFAKVGLVAWDTDITSVQNQQVIFSESESGTDTAYGFGLGWWVGANVTLRLEGEVFTIGDYDDVALYSVGVSYTF